MPTMIFPRKKILSTSTQVERYCSYDYENTFVVVQDTKKSDIMLIGSEMVAALVLYCLVHLRCIVYNV